MSTPQPEELAAWAQETLRRLETATAANRPAVSALIVAGQELLDRYGQADAPGKNA